MSEYGHLSLDERFVIARLRESGRSKRSIASALGRSPSTIKRELERNSNADGCYRPETAKARYLGRRAKGLVLDRLDDVARFVVERLHENWMPEQITGWLKGRIGNFLPTLALPQEVEHWSLTTLREKLIKIGGRVVRHGRYVTFQLAEVAVRRGLFREILRLIDGLRPAPLPP